MSVSQSGVSLVSTGVTLPPFDNFTMTLSSGDTVETWEFFVFGTGTAGTGFKVATWILTYTDSGRTVLTGGVYRDNSV